jgi:hypothetical protein
MRNHVVDPVFRVATAADLPQLRALFGASFGHVRAEAYDRWRFFETPYGPAPTIVADRDGALIASYTVWPNRLNVGGEVVRGAISMDTMTHPAHRGGGLFLKLAQACYAQLAKDGYEILYGFPNTNSYPGFIRRLNWDHVTDVAFYRRWINRYARKPAPLPAVGRIVAAMSPKVVTSGFAIEQREPAADEVTKLRDFVPTQNLCRIERAPEWLAWRYHPPLGKSYAWLCAHANGVLQGACAISYDPADRRSMMLAELFGAPTALPVLAGAALDAAARLGAEQVQAMCLDPDLEKALAANGFERRETTPLIVKALTLRTLKANVHDAKAWRIFGGDFDIV